MTVTRRQFIQRTALGSAGLCAMPAWGERTSAAPRATKPNILFIFPDQWRSHAFGYRGDPNVRTPNIDRLVAEGTEFTRAYSNHPVCSPARSMLQSGLYSHQNGFLRNNFYLEQHPDHLGYRLKDAGYQTGYIGKWHLDGHERPGFVPPHRRQGWDDFHGFNRGHWYRLNDPNERQARYFTPDGKLIFSDVFEPILQTDIAIDFMKRHEDSTEPWALMVSYGPPHDPYTPPPSHDRFNPDDIQWRDNVPTESRQDEETREMITGYYGLCELMDDQIGRLLKQLEESGQADNTYVVFSSDHGDMLGSHGRHAKLIPFEEASSIPLIIRGPGVERGQKVDQLVSIVDYPPSLLALAGTTPGSQMVGQDVTPALYGKPIENKPVLLEGFMHLEDRQWRAIVTDRYKLSLVVTEHEGPGPFNLENYLFDLVEDPYEMNNLYNDPAHQDLVKKLTALRAEIAGRTGDPYPALTSPAPEHPTS